MTVLQQALVVSGVGAILGSAACSCDNRARDKRLSASVSSAAVIPSIAASSSGSATVDLFETRGLDPGESYKQYNIAWQLQAAPLRGAVTALHLHEGPAGTVGPVRYAFPVFTPDGNQGGGLIEYRGAFPFPQLYELADGPTLYFDVHTDTFENGEVRGQLHLVRATEWHPFFCEY